MRVTDDPGDGRCPECGRLPYKPPPMGEDGVAVGAPPSAFLIALGVCFGVVICWLILEIARWP